MRALVLRITERCNLRCDYCYAAGHPAPDMTEETAIAAVKLCCGEGQALRVQFTGGEPLLNFSVMEAVYRFGAETGRKLSLAVQTNGTLLTPEICRKLKAMRCAVGVSLDGIGESNRLRVYPDTSASFDAVCAGIRCLGDAGMKCNLTTVVTGQNAHKLEELADLALWLGNVAGVGLDLFRPIGRGCENAYMPQPEKLRQGLSQLLRKQRQMEKLGIPFRIRELDRVKSRVADGMCGDIYCYAQTDDSIAVDGRGDLWPCSSLVGSSGCCLGNLRDGLPRHPRKALALSVGNDCPQCKHYALCRGGCPAGYRATDGAFNTCQCVLHQCVTEELEERG